MTVRKIDGIKGEGKVSEAAPLLGGHARPAAQPLDSASKLEAKNQPQPSRVSRAKEKAKNVVGFIRAVWKRLCYFDSYEQCLEHAVKQGDRGLVRGLAVLGVKTLSRTKRSPLEIAYGKKDIPMIKRLLANGANPLVGDVVLLSQMVRDNQLEIAQELIDSGLLADVNIMDASQATPLALAYRLYRGLPKARSVRQGASVVQQYEAEVALQVSFDRVYKFITFLMGRGAHLGRGYGLFYKAVEEEPELALRLLTEGEVTFNPLSGNEQDLLVFRNAVQSGHLPLVQKLYEQGLPKGLDINRKDESGLPPLGYAVRGDQRAIALFLAQQGADFIAMSDKNECNFLVETLSKGWAEVGEALLDHSWPKMYQQKLDEILKKSLAKARSISDPAERDRKRSGREKARECEERSYINGCFNWRDAQTNHAPIHFACHLRHEGLVQKVVTVGADMEAEDGEGMTPLHLTCQLGLKQAFETLLEHQQHQAAKSQPMDSGTLQARHEAELQALQERQERQRQVTESRALYGDQEKELHFVMNAQAKELQLSKGSDLQKLQAAELQVLRGRQALDRQTITLPELQALQARELEALKARQAAELQELESRPKAAEPQEKASTRNQNGETAFHLCAATGNLEFAQALIAQEGNRLLQEKDGGGCTPFVRAIRAGHIEMASYLADLADMEGTEALSELTGAQYRAFIEAILKVKTEAGKCKYNPMQFMAASMKRQGQEALKLLIEAYEADGLDIKRKDGNTKLSLVDYAISAGLYDKAVELRHQGVEMGRKSGDLSNEEYRALAIRFMESKEKPRGPQLYVAEAAKRGDEGLLKYLREVKRVDLSQPYNVVGHEKEYEKGYSALHIAAKYGSLDAVKYLIEGAGIADHLCVTGVDKSPVLHIALDNALIKGIGASEAERRQLLRNRTEVAHYLIGRYAGQKEKLDQKDARGNTALHLTALQGKPQMTKRLLKAGANPDVTNNEGQSSQTPLHFVCRAQPVTARHYEVARVLLAACPSLRKKPDARGVVPKDFVPKDDPVKLRGLLESPNLHKVGEAVRHSPEFAGAVARDMGKQAAQDLAQAAQMVAHGFSSLFGRKSPPSPK